MCISHIHIYDRVFPGDLRLHASTAGGTDSIPGWGIKIRMLCGVAKKRDLNIYVYVYVYIQCMYIHIHIYIYVCINKYGKNGLLYF